MTATKSGIPELDLARIQRYCDGKVPARLHDKIRIELDVRGSSVTILECRPPWSPAIGPEWTRMPIARLRLLVGRGVWLLDWSDRNSRWHLYDDIEPSPHVEPLLGEIEKGSDLHFLGLSLGGMPRDSREPREPRGYRHPHPVACTWEGHVSKV